MDRVRLRGTSRLQKRQSRRSAPRGIAGLHIKNETAEPGEGLGGLAHLDKGPGSRDGVALIYRHQFKTQNARRSIVLRGRAVSPLGQ